MGWVAIRSLLYANLQSLLVLLRFRNLVIPPPPSNPTHYRKHPSTSRSHHHHLLHLDYSPIHTHTHTHTPLPHLVFPSLCLLLPPPQVSQKNLPANNQLLLFCVWMEASSVLHQVMNSHSLDEVLGCGNQAAHNPQQQQMMHSHHSPGEQHPHHLQQDQQQQLAAQQQQQQQPASDPSKRLKPQPEQALRCPRCDSTNTKFCYYNNYSLSQPRYFCKGCRRYWTQGGTLRNVPVGGGCRKKRPSSTSSMVITAAKLNKIQVVTSSAAQEHHCSPVPTPDPASSPLHLPQHSTGAPTAASSTLGYDPSDLSLAFARLQQKTQQQQQQHVDDHAAAFLHLLPGGTGGGQTAVSAAPTSSGAGSGFLDFLRGGSGFLDGGGAFCNPYGSSGFSGSGLLLGSGGDSDAPLLPIGELGVQTSPVVVKQEPGSRGVLDGGDANSKGGATSTSSSMMAMMGFHHHHLHHQWAAPHQQVQMQMQHPFMLGGNAAAAAAVGGADVGFASGLGGTAIDYWSTFGPAPSWHGLVNSSLM